MLVAVAGRPGRAIAKNRLLKNREKCDQFTFKIAVFSSFFHTRQICSKMTTKIDHFNAQLTSKTRHLNLCHLPSREMSRKLSVPYFIISEG